MRIGFYSTLNGCSWGGSEELWSSAAEALLRDGREVCLHFRKRNHAPRQLQPLIDLGAVITCRRGSFFGKAIRKLLRKFKSPLDPITAWLQKAQPDFVLISISYHMDDLLVAHACHAAGVPYGLLVQAASPHQWLCGNYAESQRTAYANAARCYFVSAQNRDILEANLGLDLSDAEIVDNPFKVSVYAAPPWPESNERYKLACVARVHFQSKAQDVLLQVLRQPKWRERPLELTLYGADGGSLPQFESLIDLYNLHDTVKLGGFVDNIETVWSRHHGLILPSRYEGNPLAMIEAMMCGRMPIVTNVGRAGELIDDNHSGFVAPAATVELVDDALERAWQRRQDWQEIGANAAKAVRQRHSLKPAQDFADLLVAATQPRRRAVARPARATTAA